MAKNILIVNDDLELLQFLTDTLSSKGFNVIQAVEGRKTVSIATDHLPDLIILYIDLPDIDGIEVAQLNRENPKTKATPIVAAAGLIFLKEKEKFLQTGFDDYVAKPIPPNENLSAINVLLE